MNTAVIQNGWKLEKGFILDFLELVKINEKVERNRHRFHLMDVGLKGEPFMLC